MHSGPFSRLTILRIISTGYPRFRDTGITRANCGAKLQGGAWQICCWRLSAGYWGTQFTKRALGVGCGVEVRECFIDSRGLSGCRVQGEMGALLCLARDPFTRNFWCADVLIMKSYPRGCRGVTSGVAEEWPPRGGCSAAVLIPVTLGCGLPMPMVQGAPPVIWDTDERRRWFPREECSSIYSKLVRLNGSVPSFFIQKDK
jgi:hypothetical protein